MLEMLRNVLDIMQRNKTFRAQHGRDLPPPRARFPSAQRAGFCRADREFLGRLRERVELVRFTPGQVICRQGDPADSFYLVRIGFVKVSETHPGGELVLAYLSRGDYFGEIGLLGGGARTATCTALDHVELVRIRGDDFAAMMEQFPEVRRSLEQAAQERQQANRERMSLVQQRAARAISSRRA